MCMHFNALLWLTEDQAYRYLCQPSSWSSSPQKLPDREDYAQKCKRRSRLFHIKVKVLKHYFSTVLKKSVLKEVDILLTFQYVHVIYNIYDNI